MSVGVGLSERSSYPGEDPRSPSGPARTGGCGGGRLPARSVHQLHAPCRWPAGNRQWRLSGRLRHRRRTDSSSFLMLAMRLCWRRGISHLYSRGYPRLRQHNVSPFKVISESRLKFYLSDCTLGLLLQRPHMSSKPLLSFGCLPLHICWWC